MKKFFIIVFLIISVLIAKSQHISNLRVKNIEFSGTSLKLDSLSIIPGSFFLLKNDSIISDDIYTLNYGAAIIYFDSLTITDGTILLCKYRVFPINFLNTYSHKPSDLIKDSLSGSLRKTYKINDKPEDFFSDTELNNSGSISRGIRFGNNQNAAVNSEFNLQIAGKLNPDLYINANLSDNNIPIQEDGTSQYLREFDKVFIELTGKKSKLIFGDFQIKKPEGYFLNYTKKVQGAGFETRFETNKKKSVYSAVNTSVSKGNYNRQKIQGIEGNQGPYKLIGGNGESFIIILSGTEKIYINGKLLNRGYDNDYIIDYNTAELTFTAQQLITKDSRIIAEFEYSEMSYARFILASEFKIKTENSRFFLNLVSESDAKNQTIRQDLTDEQKIVLSEIGDDIENANVLNAVPVVSQITEDPLYKKSDTLINNVLYKDIYVFSVDSTLTKYRLGFSYVGENKGNYVRLQSSLNGKLYEWIQPSDGIPQGNYEPVKKLISPQKKEVLNFGASYAKHKIFLYFESAVSNNDLNTFSDIGDKNNFGFAGKTGFKYNILNKDTSFTKLNIGADYSFINHNFNAFESFRNPEFERDRNIENLLSSTDEHFLYSFIEYKRKNFGKLIFSTDILSKNKDYSSYKNLFQADIRKKRYNLYVDVNLLESKQADLNTTFIRYQFKIETNGKQFIFGVTNSGELNKFIMYSNDSLSSNSYQFNQTEVYLKSSEKHIIPYSFSYTFRKDFKPNGSEFNLSAEGHDFKFSANILNTKNRQLKTNVSYRILNIIDSINDFKQEKNITGKMDYKAQLLKGAITNNLFAEHMTGLEQAKEFVYIEVQNGQGYFTWEDFNKNNQKELNEFVKANFNDQSNYIRISLPSNEYKPVYNQTINYVLQIIPKRIWNNEKGVKKILTGFSEKAAFKFNRKITNESPFYNIQVPDSSTLSLNNYFNNNLNYNIFKTKTKFNFGYFNIRNKLLLINGTDSKKNNYFSYSLNQHFKNITITNEYKHGTKNYSSEFFTDNNYSIRNSENHFSTDIKINKLSNFIIHFQIKNKNNQTGEEGLKSYSIGSEYILTDRTKGIINFKFDYVNMDFKGNENSSISYEILEGLKPGSNYIWSVLWQKKISEYLQIELNYNGRKSEVNKTIHSGGLNIRAVF